MAEEKEEEEEAGRASGAATTAEKKLVRPSSIALAELFKSAQRNWLKTNT